MSNLPFVSILRTVRVSPGREKALRAAVLIVLRTFDLRSACPPLSENVCPHHGTSPCDCQLIVLLIYAQPMEPPNRIVLHSHRGRTEVQWDVLAGGPDESERRAMILAAPRDAPELPVNIDLEVFVE